MSDTFKEFTESGTNYYRTLAGRQLPAVKAYGNALQDFADRKIDEVEFGKSVINLGMHEYLRSAEDLVKLSFEFYSKLLSTTGVKVSEVLGGTATSSGKSGAKR